MGNANAKFVWIGMALLLGAAAPTIAQDRLLVDDVRGSVRVRRASWRQFEPLKEGASLGPSDELKWTNGGSVQAFCLATKHRETIQAPTAHPRCTHSAPGEAVSIAGYDYDPPRKDLAALERIPRLLEPRAGKVLTPTPLIRWKPVSGVDKYEISLDQGRWTATTSATSLRYPANAPRLIPGRSYSFTIRANNARSTDEDPAGFRFTVVSSSEARQTDAELAAIGLHRLSPQNTLRLKLAALIARELYAAAGELFDRSPSRLRTAFSYELIGSMDVDLKLERDAERAYLEGMRRAETNGDAEERAVLARKLGTLYRSMGIEEAAARRLKEAQVFFERVGDEVMVKTLAETLVAIGGK